MPVSWWDVKATLDGTLIMDEEVKLPGKTPDNEAMNRIALTVYGLAQCMMAPAGAQLNIIIQQVQTPWWWD